MIGDVVSERSAYIDLIGPILPGLISKVFERVIRDNLPADVSVDTSMVKVDDTEVFDTSRCSSCIDTQDVTTPRSKSFLYKNNKFYYENGESRKL